LSRTGVKLLPATERFLVFVVNNRKETMLSGGPHLLRGLETIRIIRRIRKTLPS
jgi:hypothetical protein